MPLPRRSTIKGSASTRKKKPTTRRTTTTASKAKHFTQALKAAGSEVDFLPIAGAYHNLCQEELLPWTDTPWEEMGWKALAFFQRHLCQ